MGALRNLPFFVVLMAIASAAMAVPGAHALAIGDWATARVFLQSSGLFAILTALIAVATAGHRVRSAARSQLMTLVAAFLVLPVMLAVPLYETVRATTFLNAWFEMVSSLTTTGATLFAPDRLPPSVHLWRALTGWLGGYFMWVVAIAILEPMNIGGFEVTSGAPVGAGARVDRVRGQRNAEEARERMLRHAGELLPIYTGLTIALWIGLLVGGAAPLVAVCHAMSVMATSGISPLGMGASPGAGLVGEALIFVFFAFAISRSSFMRFTRVGPPQPLARDYEAQLGVFLVVLVPSLLFLRHWVGAFDVDVVSEFDAALGALWGSTFTVLSFLSTTGFVSENWDTARAWSGLESPGMVLLGLALIGGGVATTAGGVKLMRVYALYKHGQRELDRLVYPHSVGGAGTEARRIRGQGAYVSWIFFMLFALSVAVVACLLALVGTGFDASMILTVAALANCGPLASVVLATPLSYAELGDAAKIVLAVAMVLGRLETLAFVALFNPGFWRA